MTFRDIRDDLSEKISILESKIVYSGEVCVRLDKLLFDQKIINAEIVDHSPSVGLIPVTDNNDIFLVFQYRHAIGRNLLEIPAGKIEKGESPEQAAIREMKEEIGYTGNVYPFIQLFLAPGYDTERMYIFVARDLKIEYAVHDYDEKIIVKRLKFADAVEKSLNGDIVDSKTVASILAYRARYPS
jgi:ADP-ribose diphosphatase